MARGRRRPLERQTQRVVRHRSDGADFTLGTDFSGMEIVRVALENTGFKPKDRFACEKMAAARRLTQHTFPNIDTVFEDITNRDLDATPEVDLYVAGVPCQPWAAGGCHGGLEDPRGRLWVCALKYVTTRRPKAVVLENVPGMLWEKFRHVLEDILNVLPSNGYRTVARVLDTADHGLPQHRPRPAV